MSSLRLNDRVSPSDIIQRVIILLSVICFVIFLVLPVLMIFSNVVQDSKGNYVGLQNFRDYFANPSLLTAIGNSLKVSVIATVISVSTAFMLAYGMNRTAIKCKAVYKYIAMLPLFVPTMVHGLALTYLFGKKGIITSMGIDFPVAGELGIIIAEVIYTLPQAYMVLMVALDSTDYRLYEAASAFGSNPVRSFFTITLPGAKYGIISAATLCFTLSFTDFGAPQAIGANYPVLSTSIYKYVVGQQNFQMGAVIGVLLTIPAVISFAIDRITAKKAANNEISSKAVAFKITPSKGRDIFYQIFCTVVSLLILSIFLAVFTIAFIKRWPYEKVFTLDHFNFSRKLLGSGISTFVFSIKMAALTAVIGTAIVFVTAYMVYKSRPFPALRKTVHFFAMLPMALPGMVVGLAYIMFFNKPYFDINFLHIRIMNSFGGLYQTMWIMVIANIVHMFSATYITASTALRKLDKEYENAADSMNIPFYRIMGGVSLPMSITAVLEIAQYFFLNSMTTISALVFLYSPQSKPAALSLVSMEDNGDFESAAAMSLIIFACNVGMRIIYEIVNRTVVKRMNRWKNPKAAEDNTSKAAA